MKIAVNRLDAESVEYLQNIEANSGREFNGVYIRRSASWFAGPRGGWGFYLVMAGVFFAIAAGLALPGVLDGNDLRMLSIGQAVAAGFGVLFLLTGIVRFLRPKPERQFGSFLFADAQHLWDVTQDRVDAVPLESLVSVSGQHNHMNGVYQNTSLTLSFSWGSGTWIIPRKEDAEQLARFLNVISGVRHSDNDDVRTLAAVSPEWLGAMAGSILRYGPSADLSDLDHGRKLPVPFEDEPVEGTASSTTGGALSRWAIAGAVAVGGLFLFPMLNNQILDAHLFAQIPTQDNGQLTQIDRYLHVFPDGQHAAEVRVMRDDRLFARAQREATQFDSPRVLREYLADAHNQRHRDEARQLIAGFYDRAIADLRQRSQDNAEQINPQLFDAVLALLESMKTAERPVVTVGFVATQDPEPITPEAMAQEALEHAEYLRDEPQLQGVMARLGGNSAILPLGDTFTPEWTTRREQIILERLRAAVQQGLKQDILTLEPVSPGQKPVMEVAYHVTPPGGLYIYTETQTNEFGFAFGNETVTVKGLLRGYNVGWTIKVNPPGGDQEYVCEIDSQPATSLNYDSHETDPEWAPYAILLYSAFYDMSDVMIRGFALDPGPAPNAFSFDAVASNQADVIDFGPQNNPFPDFNIPQPQFPEFPMPNPLIPGGNFDPNFPNIPNLEFPEIPRPGEGIPDLQVPPPVEFPPIPMGLRPGNVESPAGPEME